MGIWTGPPAGAGYGAWRLDGAPFLTFPTPVVFGGWFRVMATTAGYEWHLSGKCGTNAYFNINLNPQSSLYWEVFNGSTIDALHFRGSNLALTLGQWYFSLCRWNPPTGVRQQTISEAGVITQGVGSTAQGTLTAMTYMQLGTDSSATGRLNIAEFFALDPDPFGADAYISNALLRQIAFNGPFSIPHVARSVRLYVPFRDGTPNGLILPRTTRALAMNSRPPVSPHPPVNWVSPREYPNLGIV
jgi:hypothetical protein